MARARSSTEGFYLDHSQVLPGDVLVTSGRSFVSRVIETLTKGTVSHAAMCVAPTLVFEARRDGLYTTPLIFACFADAAGQSGFGPQLPKVRAAKLLRHPSIRGLEPRSTAYYAFQDNLAAIAGDYLGMPYSRLAHLLAALPSNNPLQPLGVWLASRHRRSLSSRDRGVFCSELVARIYAASGVALFATAREPFTASPATLLKESELEEVRDAIVRGVPRDCSPNEAEMIAEAYRHSESRDFQAKRTRALRRALSEITKPRWRR